MPAPRVKDYNGEHVKPLTTELTINLASFFLQILRQFPVEKKQSAEMHN